LIFLTIDVIPHRMHPARSEQQRHELSKDILQKKILKIQNLKFSQFFVVVIVGSSGKHFCLRFVCWINNTNYERFLLSFSEEEEKKFLFVLRYQMMSFMQSWIHRRYFLKKIKCKTLINKKLKMRRMQNLLTSKTFTKGFILLNLL